MPDSTFHTTYLRDCLDRMKAGDPAARSELVRAAQLRLEQLAHRMTRKFRNVRRWADTDDVFQGAVMRLLKALEAVPVADTREFMNLAALQVRRELLDLARHYYGPHGLGANHASVAGDAPAPDGEARDPAAADLDRWAALHEAVEKLSAEEREVFGLRFYHGWTEKQIAELFDVSEKWVYRRWREASVKLSAALGGELPDL